MQTDIATELLETSSGQLAERILRSCVHCGFCTATCPTYQLTGDELDGPRGRIYLIKQLLEGEKVTSKTRYHLDRCLTCRSCETTCPSGVEYGKLLDIGRDLIESRVQRSLPDRLKRQALRLLLAYPAHLRPFLGAGRLIKPLLPEKLKKKVPDRQAAIQRPPVRHPRQMLLVEGCAQPVVTRKTNDVTARVLDRLGISVVNAEGQGCCGALSHHLSVFEEAKSFARANIDAWWPYIQQGAEAVLVTASGCGVHVKDYDHLLHGDPKYADKAQAVAELTRDLCEVLDDESLDTLIVDNTARIAFHAPCSLQHGQKLTGRVESILHKLGFQLAEVADAHLCCGSAGTYSILQPKMSNQLLSNKLVALSKDNPDIIVSANVGCQLHLNSASSRPVQHWIELLDPA